MKCGRIKLLGLIVAIGSAWAVAAPSPIQKVQRFQEDLRRAHQRAEVRERIETNWRVERDIVYGCEQPERQSLDLYLPNSPQEKPLPLVVWIHGGAWKSGDKRPCPAAMLLPEGFAVASLNYRFSSSAVFPAQIHDCKAAIRWLRAHAMEYAIDPNRIGVWGGSAGGHLAALLGTTNGNEQLEGTVGDYDHVSSDVQAVCDWFGPSDFFSMPIGTRRFGAGKEPEVLLFGGPVSQKKELAELASPFHHADKKTVPFLIMHGDADDLVPVGQSRILHDKLKAGGTDTTLLILPGQGHGFTPEAQAFKPVREFFKRTLGTGS